MTNHFVVSAALTFWFSLVVILSIALKRPMWWKIFFAYWASICFWSFTVGYQQQLLSVISPRLWGWLLHLGCLLIPTFFLHFALELSAIAKKRTTLLLVYTLTGVYLALNTFTNMFTDGHVVRDYYAYPKPATIYPLYFVSFIGSVIYGTVQMVLHAQTVERNLRSALISLIVFQILAYSGALDNFLIMADIRIFPLYPFGLYLVLPYAAASCFLILRTKTNHRFINA